MTLANQYTPDIVFHPATTLNEKLEEMGMSRKEFALRTGKPEKTILAVLKEERVIVDNIPGTTRDSINTEFKYKNINYLLSDTAGIRHKSKISSKVDAYSSRRTKDSITASSVCLVIMDGWQGLFKDDIRIIEMVLNEGKGCVLAVNKWDMVNNMNFLQYKEMLFSRMKKISNIPVIFTSAKNGYNVLKAFDLLKEVGDNRDRWIATSKLNNLINKAFKKHFPPVRNGKRLKIYYCTQVASSPPCIKFFINDKKFIDNSYMMYLEGRLREEFFLKGVPLNFVYESSHKGKDN